ncbi:MAG: PAS domain S-box protein, partial [Desulfobulbus sp.]|nr:PAS domain S-box protein [Desulfobulbus sp.]
MGVDSKTIAQYVDHYKLLREIGELQVESVADDATFLSRCCALLLKTPEYLLIWVGQTTPEGQVVPITIVGQTGLSDSQCRELILTYLQDPSFTGNLAMVLALAKPVISEPGTTAEIRSLHPFLSGTDRFSWGSWPLIHDQKIHGILNIFSTGSSSFQDLEYDFISNIAAAISRALSLRHATRHLRLEHDFNCEIVQTVQALLVSLSPCGEILSFNPTAEEVTGFNESEVKGKFWVDVLISPEKRAESQNRFSNVLKDGHSEMNFQAELLTRTGEKRTIEWHGSVRPDIEQGKVGLVLFGIDITTKLAADQALNHALAKWENIFSSVQDPALIVSTQGLILDVNPATVTAARKPREALVGKGVCEILHGNRRPGAICPLEVLLSQNQSRIFETELQGLRGNFLLTVSPLRDNGGLSGAILLLARDMTEEQLMKAEALRAAQLASVGELAAGV